jgi:hypothetical protein
MVWRTQRCRGAGSMGTRRSLLPLPRTWRTAPASPVRMLPTLARHNLSARRPASSEVRISARSRSIQSLRRRSGSPSGRSATPQRNSAADPWEVSWRAWVGRPAASDWPRSARRCTGSCTARSRLISTAESSSPHVFGVARERRAQRRGREVAQRHRGHIRIAAGDQCGDRVEVLAVGLHGVPPRACGCRGRPGSPRTTRTRHLRCLRSGQKKCEPPCHIPVNRRIRLGRIRRAIGAVMMRS